jgi:hypothetical protein
MESPEAQSIGISSVLFLIIFLVCVVLLDVATICKDLKIARNNLRNFSRRFNTKKKISQNDLQPIAAD